MKVGVIGTGNMGENHVRTYLSLQDKCQLIGIYDNDKERAQKIAKKYNVKQFHSMSDLLKAIDAASIAVPTEFHYEIGVNCVNHKVHMLMEKPITSTVAQAENLLDKANNAGVKLQVGHIELFNPFIQYLGKELADQTIIGIEFHRMSPFDERMKHVDVVNDLMIHDIYILQKLLDDKDLDFCAMGKTVEKTPEHAVVISRSKQGIIAQLTASFKSKSKVRTIQVVTEDAFIEADILERKIKKTGSGMVQMIEIDETVQPLHAQLLDFIDCIQFNRTPTVSGEDGIKALQITNKISDIIRKMD
ncbi:Gfo/Idh/MocA family protein [Virgibacillus oceani]|uniref:Oxidoreductase n=1 Tax=Virgibacillus oceani TaxID=1479511 RepID=A0A917M4V8_9BACI|nr:Gfo/Idh/MocA family oxidoreductase [Virgibacillus oceani]GGG75560.1 oxidoreductase [Virgibacillus oceani]